MSVAAVAWAFDQTLPPNEKVVLLALADCENGQSLACMPGQEHLAEKASVSVRTVQRMLIALEEKGLIKRDRRSLSGGQRTSDSYVLALRDNLTGGEANMTTVSGGNTTTVSGIREPEERTGSTPPTPSDDSFEIAWKAWPNKSSKKPAAKAWAKARAAYRNNPVTTRSGLETRNMLPVVLEHAAAHRKNTPHQYIPMMSTWLNQERWTDPLARPRPQQGGGQARQIPEGVHQNDAWMYR